MRARFKLSWLRPGYQSKHLQRQAVADLWPLGPLCREHVQDQHREGGFRAEAHELSWALRHVRPDHTFLQGPAAKDG